MSLLARNHLSNREFFSGAVFLPAAPGLYTVTCVRPAIWDLADFGILVGGFYGNSSGRFNVARFCRPGGLSATQSAARQARVRRDQKHEDLRGVTI
jgi:hypothetical protein